MVPTMGKLPKTMLAWQKHLPSTVPVRVEVPVPIPDENEILVQIHAAGVCHSDVALRDITTLPAEFHGGADVFTFGHEGCGEIVLCGAKVRDFQCGDMVALISVPGCGKIDCGECSRGVPQICTAGPRYGGGKDGFFAPYAIVNPRAAVKLPEGVDAPAGAVATDACATAYHAVVGRAQVKKDETVLLFGLGGLGFNALQILLSIGARVIVVDQRQSMVDEAVAFGVSKEDAVPAGTANIVEWARQRDLKIDKVIDFVVVPETFKTAADIVRRGGTIVLVGLLSPELQFPAQMVVRRQLSVLGSYAGTLADVQVCLELIAQKLLVPHVSLASLVEFPTIMDDLHHGKIKGRVALVPES